MYVYISGEDVQIKRLGAVGAPKGGVLYVTAYFVGPSIGKKGEIDKGGN